MIADNRLTEIASWDDRLLAEQLKELSLLDLDFSLELTGFEMGEIDLRIASLEDLPEHDDDPADILPELSAGPPISAIGDLWPLGPHHVLCGNALHTEAFGALLSDERAAMVFTDPPYNVMCRSMVMQAALARSIIARFRWLRARWIKQPSPPFLARLAAT